MPPAVLSRPKWGEPLERSALRAIPAADPAGAKHSCVPHPTLIQENRLRNPVACQSLSPTTTPVLSASCPLGVSRFLRAEAAAASARFDQAGAVRPLLVEPGPQRVIEAVR